jgi:hypothetical protein
MGHGKAINPTLRPARFRIILAALSASMKKGIGHVFFSVMRERTKPGQIAETRIPSLLSMPLNASAQVFTQLLVAEYEGQLLSGPYPAIDDVMSICRNPGSIRSRARFLKISIAGSTMLTAPPTFMPNVRLTLLSVSSPVPTPAFEKTISIGEMESHFSIHAFADAASVTSRTSA